MKRLWVVPVGLLLVAVNAQAQSLETDAMNDLFKALRPKVTIEIAEANLNAYLRDHPSDLGISADFTDPRVSFNGGLVEFSACTKLLFIASRVSVSLAPQIVQGRLRLVVRKVRASGIPLPTYFHKGVAEAITGPINQALERNELMLLGVEIIPDVVRATAQVGAS